MRTVQIILRIMSNKNAILTICMESTLWSSLCNYYQIKKQRKCMVNASLYLLERTLQQAKQFTSLVTCSDLKGLQNVV